MSAVKRARRKTASFVAIRLRGHTGIRLEFDPPRTSAHEKAIAEFHAALVEVVTLHCEKWSALRADAVEDSSAGGAE